MEKIVTFPETGTKISFDPDQSLIEVSYAEGHFDVTVLQRELGWGVVTIEGYLTAAPHAPVNIFMNATHLMSRTKIPMRESIHFITMMRNEKLGKFALCCGPESTHFIAASLRVLTGKEVKYFDTEEEALRWLTSSPHPSV